jgi:D-alanyl-D-alanine carboxypeptidase/D-alanyl-D-alanine-endopeptidase (penicillin-binding protein 4)
VVVNRIDRSAAAGWVVLAAFTVGTASLSPAPEPPPHALRERLAGHADAVDRASRGHRLWAAASARGTPVPGDVLPPVAATAPLPRPAVLQTRLSALATASGLGAGVTYEVRDALTGRLLAGRDGATPRSAASTTKILTGAAVLAGLGAGTTLATRVLAGSAPEEIVLQGGGDVLLGRGSGSTAVNGRAGLADLAERTARRLRADGRRDVVVRLDDRLFAGPTLPPGAGQDDVAAGFIAPAAAIAVDAGRVRRGRDAPRSADPALAAARRFVELLRDRGIGVTGVIARTRADDGAPVLAEVRSAPVAELVEYMLTRSDNTVAEALARLVAAHEGRPVTVADAAVAVVDRVQLLGVPVTGVKLVGGSGLGRRNVIPAVTLTRVLAAAAADTHPELRSLLSGLPVASASGTLSDRFRNPSARSGAGVVRAKTGTLSGVTTLAGTVVDADGRLLVFALMADRVPTTVGGKRAADAFAAALAGCGCR